MRRCGLSCSLAGVILVGHQVARSNRPLLVDLQRCVVSSAREVADKHLVQPKRRRVHDAPVTDAPQDAGQKLWLKLTHRDRAGQKLPQQLQKRLSEPPVERTALDLWSPVLEVRAQYVVLTPAFVGASGKDQGHHELEHVELPLPLLDTILLRELANRLRAQRLAHMLPQ